MARFLMCAAGLFALAFPAHAAEMPASYVVTELAKVVSVISEEERPVPGTDVPATSQTLRAELLEGPEKGAIVTVENDFLVLKAGDRFYAVHTVDVLLGVDRYAVGEPYRLDGLLVFFVLFVLSIFLVGGKQGVRGLIALSLSLLFILYLLLPGILAGFPPLLVAFGVSSLIIVLGSYITHGFNRVTTSAVLGMVTTIALTAFLAHLAIALTHLSGFASDEAVYLNIGTAGRIDFAGLLLGGMLIGILGILYDAAIGQSVSVDELLQAAPDAPKAEIFGRAMRIGREHIGALVNTLAIAYVGVALPLLLLFYSVSSDTSFLTTINREVFAEEAVRVMVGSIGIMLTVPVTTAIAVVMLGRSGPRR